jgi:hypothetical protein
MDTKELERARELIESLQQDVKDGVYFEIDSTDGAILARYIHELETSLLRHARYQPDVMALMPAM